MSSCPTCGHQNPASFSVCARCGANLPGGHDGAAAMAAELAKARKRNRAIYTMVAVVGLALLAAFAVRDRMVKAEVGKKLVWLDAWVEKDKNEVGALINCLTQSNTPVDAFVAAAQLQAKIEQAVGVQPKTFAEHVRTECVPLADRVIAAFPSSSDVPDEFRSGYAAFAASLPKLKDGITTFADRLDVLLAGSDLATKLQAAGEAWHTQDKPSPESIAFEKFLQCSIPSIGQLKDAQALLQALASECYKKDAAGFMQTVQDKCGPLVMKVEISAKPSPTYNATMKKFFEPEQRMMKAWEDCFRRARKGSRDNNLSQFLHAFGEYGEARVNIAREAKALKGAS